MSKHRHFKLINKKEISQAMAGKGGNNSNRKGVHNHPRQRGGKSKEPPSCENEHFEVQVERGRNRSRLGRPTTWSHSKSFDSKRQRLHSPQVNDQGVEPSENDNSLTRQELESELDQIDEFHPDLVKVAVDANEEREFITDEEDLEVESENKLEIRLNTEKTNSDADSEVVLSQGMSTSTMDFDHLKENPAF